MVPPLFGFRRSQLRAALPHLQTCRDHARRDNLDWLLFRFAPPVFQEVARGAITKVMPRFDRSALKARNANRCFSKLGFEKVAVDIFISLGVIP